jgi:hypothetical protein
MDSLEQSRATFRAELEYDLLVDVIEEFLLITGVKFSQGLGYDSVRIFQIINIVIFSGDNFGTAMIEEFPLLDGYAAGVTFTGVDIRYIDHKRSLAAYFPRIRFYLLY